MIVFPLFFGFGVVTQLRYCAMQINALVKITQAGFVVFCWNKTQGYSSTFQGLNFSFQGLFYRRQMNLLMWKLRVLINIVVSVVHECIARI